MYLKKKKKKNYVKKFLSTKQMKLYKGNFAS